MTSAAPTTSAPRITFIGAGSVVFTRDLLADILRFPEPSSASIALHDIDAERLATAQDMAHRVARQIGTTQYARRSSTRS
jgi:alpha-galactosidase